MMNIKMIKPLYTGVVTTMDKVTADEVAGKIVTSMRETAGSVKEIQKVIAVGDMVRGIQVGDIVKVNPMNYAIYKDKRTNSVVNNMEEYKNQITGFNIPVIELDHKNYMYLDQKDIVYVVTDYEEEEPAKDSPVIVPGKNIIIP